MRALQLNRQTLTLTEIPPPDAPGEALIRVLRAGICGTDVAMTQGYAGFSGTLGHEFVGVVERAPDPAWIGRRVVGDINVGCGDCRQCVGGDARHCALRRVLGIRARDGAFAEYLSLPLRNVHVVPDVITNRAAVFAEPLAAAGRIFEQIRLTPDMQIIVLGDGKLGQLIAQTMRAHGCHPLMVGRHAAKLELAKSFGIDVMHLDEVRPDSAATQFADVVVEATGRSEGFALAMRLVRPCGMVVLKSTFHGAWSVQAEKIVVPEVTVVGSRCGRLPDALALLASGAVAVEPLISAEFPLTDGVAAFRRAQERDALKIQLCIGEA
jgi:threonine dehydrogenase-like Zn-dependent dehydrogenase